MIVKGTTKSGIKFKLDDKIKDDARLLFLLTKAQKNEEENPMEAANNIMTLLSLIFGSDDNVYLFMNEVADKHKGVCSSSDMISEIMDMFEAINAKNS